MEVGVELEARGILLPLDDSLLLLPNRTVVEIVAYREPKPHAKTAPDWYLGKITWQHVQIPLVSFDRSVTGKKKKSKYRSRIAICNTLNGNQKLPFIGILLSAIPQLARATEDTIQPSEELGILRDFLARRLRINEREVWIPDLDAVEQAITEL